MNDLCFQLKGSVVSIIVLELYQFIPDQFSQQLQQKIDQAPQFFQNSPVVISLEKLNDNNIDDFGPLLALCREFNMQPMAFRAVPDALLDVVKKTGLALLPASARADTDIKPVPAAPQPIAEKNEPEVVVKTVVETVVEEKRVRNPSKIITRPVRSGQQVYAEGADLVILAQVSEGAEVIADGDIHIYGTLRGRALAGVKGNTQARIFCQNLSAELVAIAGNFILSDSLREKQQWQQAAHIHLDGDDLHVSTL